MTSPQDKPEEKTFVDLVVGITIVVFCFWFCTVITTCGICFLKDVAQKEFNHESR